MQELVDTHCHIQSIGLEVGERGTRELWAKSELNADDVVSGAAGQGVTRLLCVGCDLEDSRLAVDFVQERDNCWATIGLHPHEAKEFVGKTAELEEFADLTSRPKVVAIGECGFDFYYNHSPKDAQTEVLKFQMELAIQHDLPLIFHVREAFDDFWPVFDSYQGLRGVLHSFTDSAENLAKALDRGLYIGVNGIATFAKDPAQLDVYKSVPLEKLLLETDSPYLTPVPHRGTINEPKRLGAVADFMSELRNEDRADLAKATTDNARQLFNI
ncbi:MAG TPA: TatD family hydrolase [Methylomirabilota bacterium]|nr:TatD family hydrolase [Methylomirabilota bacterium]